MKNNKLLENKKIKCKNRRKSKKKFKKKNK